MAEQHDESFIIVEDTRILGLGAWGIISLYTELSVLKGYVVYLDGRRITQKGLLPQIALEREHEVYVRLGSHPSILRYYGTIEVEPDVYSLHLELAAYRDLRTFIKHTDANLIENEQRLLWAADMALGMSHLHSRNVYHCDFSCRNVLLTAGMDIRIADFGGAQIDEKESCTREEAWYELPSRGRALRDRPRVMREIFALGCAIYEVMVWHKPYEELSREEVKDAYNQESFPDVTDVYCGDIIENCWREEYPDALEVLWDLQALRTT